MKRTVKTAGYLVLAAGLAAIWLIASFMAFCWVAGMAERNF